MLYVSRRNAVVPTDAVILPPQSFVDCLPLFSAVGDSLDASDSDITYIAPGVVETWLRASFPEEETGYTVDLSGNALTLTAVDGLLAGLAGATLSDVATLDLSGGTNSIPTPVASHLDWTFTLTFPAAEELTDEDTITINGTVFTVDPEELPGATSGVIGLSGCVTAEDVRDSALTTISGGIGWLFAVSGSDAILATVSSEASWPVVAVVPEAVLYNDVHTGVAFEKNADITTLTGAGWTVVVNELSGPVTYTP